MSDVTNKLKLKIKDFQIVKSAEFEFEKGINLIVGPSGNGKTSSLRAIRTLLLNSSGSQKFIRHGVDSTSVNMEYNGNIVEWKRTKTGSKYNINGQEYSKLGTSNLSKVLENNGFVIDDKNDILNLEGAWQVLFPYDKSDAELFKLFENIFCVSDSGKIFQTFKAEEDRLSKELNEFKGILNKNKLKIQAIENLQDKVDIDRLKSFKVNLTSLNKEQHDLSVNIYTLKQIDKFISVIPKETKIVRYDLNVLNDYIQLLKNYNNIQLVIKYLKLLRSSDTKIKVFNLDNLMQYNRLNKDISVIEQVNRYPVVENTDIKRFSKDLVTEYSKLESDIEAVKTIESYDDIVKKSKIKTFDNALILEYNEIKSNLNIINALKDELKKLKQDKDDVDVQITELNNKLSEYGTCEFCGNIIGK